MKLLLSPVRSDQTLHVTTKGHVLTLNGVELDFTPLPLGATLPRSAIASEWIASDVIRDPVEGLIVTLSLPHGSRAPHETLFPLPIVTTGDGDVALPPYNTPETENAD